MVIDNAFDMKTHIKTRIHKKYRPFWSGTFLLIDRIKTINFKNVKEKIVILHKLI